MLEELEGQEYKTACPVSLCDRHGYVSTACIVTCCNRVGVDVIRKHGTVVFDLLHTRPRDSRVHTVGVEARLALRLTPHGDESCHGQHIDIMSSVLVLKTFDLLYAARSPANMLVLANLHSSRTA